MHEKGLQGQIGDGTLDRSQGRRAAVVPRTNRLSTGRQPDVLFPLRFKSDFLCSCFRVLPKSRSGQLSTTPRGQEGRLSSGRTDPLASRPTRTAPPLRRASPRPAPTHPWYVRVLDSTNLMHGISFVRASEKSFRTVSSMLRGAKGTGVFWANRPVGVPSYPVPPRPAAPPCAVPPVVCPGFGFDKYR